MDCIICGSQTRLARYFEGIPILGCLSTDCGFQFFDRAYTSSGADDEDYYSNIPKAEILDKPWIRRRIADVATIKKRGLVAELGCGMGETAIAFAGGGFDVIGVDASHWAIAFLQDRFKKVEWIEEDAVRFLEYTSQRFDIITLFHVLEHLPDPKRVISLLQKCLKPDGIIVIEVPDVSGGQAFLKQDKWGYYLRHHLNYFDARSLTRLLEAENYHLVYKKKLYHFSYPQGNFTKDLVKGILADLGYNSIIRTIWRRK